MADGGGKQTPIPQSFVQRAVQGVRYIISGVTPETWFGPFQPIAPIAPPATAGRQFDYATGYNLVIQPRSEEATSFAQLRALADNCDLLRLVIETRKDQMERLDWNIKPRETAAGEPNPIGDDDPRIATIEAFLRRPDGVHFWNQWLRMLLEDLFVIDAPTLYARATRGGALYALEPVDGATIKRLLNADGRTPPAPDPAYQQIIKGVPAVDYTTRELIYAPRNIRTHKVYGFSPVEQILVTVNIAIRRAVHQLNYYTEGNVPEALIGVPTSWAPQQIAEFQKYWDGLLEGNLATRRHARFVPGDMKFQPLREPVLKDMYDEWLARVIAFAFSIPPTPFVQHVNRATAQSAHDQALEEGLAPVQRWVKQLVDLVLLDYFEAPDLEFEWRDDREVDPEKVAKIADSYVRAGIKSINEARDDIGLDPVEGGEQPMVYTTAGYVSITSDAGDVASAEEDSQGAAGTMHSEVGKSAGVPFAKAATRLPPIDVDRPLALRMRARVKSAVIRALRRSARSVASEVERKLVALGKVAPPDDTSRNFDGPAISAGIARSISLADLDVLIDPTEDALERLYADTGARALAQIGVGDRSELVDQVNDRAVDYARARAAELVGKSHNDAGELIDNPDARWAITAATRDELRRVIAEGLDENVGSDEIARRVRDAGAFGEERAELIARTEISRANSEAALDGYRTGRDAGVRVKKEWITAGDDLVDEEICEPNEAQGPIDLDDAFQSGDDAPPGHPNCRCALSPVVDDRGAESDEES